jgi:hypothetical protein
MLRQHPARLCFRRLRQLRLLDTARPRPRWAPSPPGSYPINGAPSRPRPEAPPLCRPSHSTPGYSVVAVVMRQLFARASARFPMDPCGIRIRFGPRPRLPAGCSLVAAVTWRLFKRAHTRIHTLVLTAPLPRRSTLNSRRCRPPRRRFRRCRLSRSRRSRRILNRTGRRRRRGWACRWRSPPPRCESRDRPADSERARHALSRPCHDLN